MEGVARFTLIVLEGARDQSAYLLRSLFFFLGRYVGARVKQTVHFLVQDVAKPFQWECLNDRSRMS
jgi:hypothetical protein